MMLVFDYDSDDGDRITAHLASVGDELCVEVSNSGNQDNAQYVFIPAVDVRRLVAVLQQFPAFTEGASDAR